MWYNESIFYQIYPLGFCEAPLQNDGIASNRINKVSEWIQHFKDLSIDAIYFSPIFESDAHGYDTRDFTKIDCRLGTNSDFKDVCSLLHQNDIKVVLDGVFNHVGRGFWAFRDVKEKKWDSQYKDWFHISFDGDSPYGDGFWYEGWEGHFELVKLNLQNENVISYLLNCITDWVNEFDIDGLRLDVAYCLDHSFLRRLHSHCKNLKNDFFLIGELLHGDYKQFVNDQMLDSCTNYECYKGLYSSFNSLNMFEITHSLLRQFGPENWTLYRGLHLFNFVDNHDVTRIASNLTDKKHLPLIYAMLFAMPGIPCIYYGSEWGAEGKKENGDSDLRQSYKEPTTNELTAWISSLSKAHKNSKALMYGDFSQVLLTNRQVIIKRQFEDEQILIAINADSEPYTAHFNANAGRARDLITGEEHDFGGGSELPAYSAFYWQIF